MYKRNYRQLTPEERHTIQIMIQAGSSGRAVAQALGRAPSTVSREIRRNACLGASDYDHAVAQMNARKRRSRGGPRAKTSQARESLVWLLKEGFTAGQVAMLDIGISERTCYRLIDADRREGGSLYRHLPRGCRPRRRCCRWRRGPIPHRRDIAQRPVEANERSEFGHWEADLVEGRDAHSYLLVLRERKSRLCLIERLLNKRSDTVTAALIRLLRVFAKTFASLTLDNGGEFAGHVSVAAALARPQSVFFARPYRACDKGSVEQLNGLIRRRYPKGTDFRSLSQTDLDALRDHLNRCPLRVTNSRPPITFLDQLLNPA